MAFVQFSRVSIAFGNRDLITDASLRLAEGSRSCLAGANGCGKSTLMKIIAGVMPFDSGERAIQKGTRISYLPQSGIVHSGTTLREEAETAFAYIHALIKRREEAGTLLQTANAETRVLIEEYHLLSEQIENSGYYQREAAVSQVFSGLGFSKSDINRSCAEFSGGWQMRIALAKILLEKPDILLLDEPTNYLDIEARNWLENWLVSFTGAYLLVSHDRYFLDVTINEVYELFNGNLKRYAGNYSAYEKVRKIELEGLIKRYEEQQEEIEKTENLIRRFRYKASKAAFAQELIKRLEKMERITIPESLKKIHINFPEAPHSGKVALTLEGIGKSYGQHQVFSNFDLTLDSGERLVVAGLNGAGKTTLLRIIAGMDSGYQGGIKYGTGICAGYFSQDAAEALSDSTLVLEYMERQAPTALIPKIRDMLGAFLFRGDDVYKSISVLSGGEKSRLALLQMFLKPMNLLILDEPTNHLDLYSKDILLDALTRFSGTIIFVSHDRAFMEALSTKTLELREGRAKLYYGSYAYYLEKQEEDAQTPVTVSSNKAAEKYAVDRQKQAAIRKLQRQEEEILKTLQELDRQKNSLEAELASPEVYSIGEKAKEVKRRLDLCVSTIEEKTHEWEKAAEELEKARIAK
jgi:ATP-binding cassette subfamily F protein 3